MIPERNTSIVDEVKIQGGGTYISVWYSDANDGYMYNIYDQEPTDFIEEIDGGLCTGTIIDAVEMAMLQAGMSTE